MRTRHGHTGRIRYHMRDVEQREGNTKLTALVICVIRFARAKKTMQYATITLTIRRTVNIVVHILHAILCAHANIQIADTTHTHRHKNIYREYFGCAIIYKHARQRQVVAEFHCTCAMICNAATTAVCQLIRFRSAFGEHTHRPAATTTITLRATDNNRTKC